MLPVSIFKLTTFVIFILEFPDVLKLVLFQVMAALSTMPQTQSKRSPNLINPCSNLSKPNQTPLLNVFQVMATLSTIGSFAADTAGAFNRDW